jgi:thymidylate synthase
MKSIEEMMEELKEYYRLQSVIQVLYHNPIGMWDKDISETYFEQMRRNELSKGLINLQYIYA